MTCIVGISHEGRAWIGGDSAGVDHRIMVQTRADKKVFANGPFVMGFTSSFRMGNLLQYALTVPRRHEGDDVFRFMVIDFVDAVRACLKAGGQATLKDAAEAGGTFIVGYAGRLFSIHDDYQVAENLDGFTAIGAGDSIALGSLHSTKGQPPAERIRKALEAAERFNGQVRSPFEIISETAVP